ncbi:unnamed protein product [Rhizoctonia solani]|uniref:RRM domain-containing protein n=1 Tax=Rhizoctonia solani TaxID=456999 RepID=A0A8H3DE98_9AGAM|nr:unnamed protein product [Rhizoctonia solani]
MDADMHIASYPQLQLIQRQHLHRMQQNDSSRSLLSPSPVNPWRSSVGAPAHGTVGTFADLSANATLPNTATLAQRVGGRTDPLFNPQNTSNVYINGLPTYFSTSQLYDLCSEFGSIVSVRTFDRLNTPEPSTYGFVLFADIDAARRCIIALRQYSDLHPSFAKTQKIPQPSADAQLSDAYEKRMERLSLFDSSNRFLAANTPQSVAARTPPIPSEADDSTWRGRVVSAPAGPRPKLVNGRSPLETVHEDPVVTPEAQADVFIQGLPLQIQRLELDALFVPHKILDDRVCKVPGVDGMPGSIAGVMRLPSMSAAREIQSRLHGLRLPGWVHQLKVMVIENHNEDNNDNPFEVQPSRTPSAAGRWSGVGLGVPPIRPSSQAFPGIRVSSMPTGSSAGIGTMASIYAPRSEQGIPARKSSAIQIREPAPIYTTVGAVGSERSSPIGSTRHAVPPPPLKLDPAFSPRSPIGSASDGSMSPVSPALTFTSSGRTPTMATIATPRHDDECKNLRGEGTKETGLDLKLGGEDGELTARAVGLAGLDE